MITCYEIWLRLWERRARILRRARTDIDGRLESPLPGQPFVHTFEVAGWARTATGAEPVIGVRAGGRAVWEGRATSPRPDVGPFAFGFRQVIKASDVPAARVLWLEVLASEAAATDRAALRLNSLPLWRGRSWLRAAPRWEYGTVWDTTSSRLHDARISVAGCANDQEWHRSGEATAAHVSERLAIVQDDSVLEVGCGAGRVGDKLAPRCRRWIGADVSRNMLAHARRALAAHRNVEFVQLNGFDLAPLADATIDVVYCTAVFMHLDEWDRYRYVTEFHRVLRPGGRAYFDNFDLCSQDGWRLFTETVRLDVAVRPPNVSKASTPQELTCYAQHAGFTDIRTETGLLWVTVTARKPEV